MLEANHPELSRAYYHLGYYFQWRPKRDNDSSGWARSKALEIAEISLPVDHPDLAFRYHGLASYYLSVQNFVDAIANYNKAIKIREKVLGSDDAYLAVSYLYGGQAWRGIGDIFRAQNFLRAAISIFEKNPNNSRSQYNRALNTYANIFFDANDYSSAIREYRKAIKIRISTSGKDSRQLIVPMNNLGIKLF